MVLVKMSDKINLGAIEVETGKYVSPTEANKTNSYICIDCSGKVILRKGEIRRAHFSHYLQSAPCTYYDHPNESQIHKDAKLLMAQMLKDKGKIQFCWECCYPPCYNTWSGSNAFSEVPNITYKDGDEVIVEYRDKDNRFVADVAVINNNDIRYIIEIKHTHKTTTWRPEPWYEVDATHFIEAINNYKSEQITENYTDDEKRNIIYEIGCIRPLKRYCYGSFCYKEKWVWKIPHFDSKLLNNSCILCNTKDYIDVSDVSTSKFTNGAIRVCIDCLEKDTVHKKIRELYS